ncbi:MAG: UDP-N-acetylglucosamine 2-epimerase (non-hydrolyzing) [Candidatus Kuenenbacteria bacterium]
MKLAIILGTRPEIIKMSPIIRACNSRSDLEYFILHTGQHYSYELDQKMLDDLELQAPKYNLGVGEQPYRKQIGLMTKNIMNILSQEKPDIVLVQGDTISVLSGALAANKLGIKIGHHEAGLRSHDLTMIEETNRIITDHISDYLFAPTPDAYKNLKEEGLTEDKIYFTGNTVVDALYQNIKLADRKVNILAKLKLDKKKYIVATAHRAENVDNRKRLHGILVGLYLTARELNLPIIYPLHPRTLKNIRIFNLKVPRNIRFLPPLGYLEFLQLEARAKLIITDSGGMQEEACIFKVPCVTVRDNTERPETVDAQVNILAGADPQKILDSAAAMLEREHVWINPFGDGHAAEKILNSLCNKLNNKNI